MIDTKKTEPPMTEVHAEGVIRFPTGLLGFPHVREYRLSEGPGTGLFWLSGAEADSPCFLLSDPFVYFDGLSLDLSPAQAEQIGAQDSGKVAVLAVTVPNVETGAWTANLQGPVVINVERALGAQLVLADQSLGVRRTFRPVLNAGESDHALAAGGSQF
jgi:flagellar assembly factor FliW